jgi:hypothetical protein
MVMLSPDRKRTRYPLCWPEGWKRTPTSERKFGQFGTVNRDVGYTRKMDMSVTVACERIAKNLAMMGIQEDDVLVSTNLRTRLDGGPRSDQPQPVDPGAAVYWRKGEGAPMQCMAIDRYTKVADNLAAIAATLEAMRAIARHGGAEILDRTFVGFAALPEHASGPGWREVLGFSPETHVTSAGVRSRFNTLIKQLHPDIPESGDREKYEALMQARDQAYGELLGAQG